MRRMTTTVLCLTLLAAPAFAEDPPKAKAAGKKSAPSVTATSGAETSEGDSTTRTYRVVTKNGEVVEESGDKSLLHGLGANAGLPDLDELMRRARSGLGDSSSSSSSSSSGSSDPAGSSRSKSDSTRSTSSASSSERSSSSQSRRVVVKDGKTVVDEETVDGERVKPGRSDRKRPDGGMDDARSRFPELDRLLRDLEGKTGPDRRGTHPGEVPRPGRGAEGGGVDEHTRLPPPAVRPAPTRLPLIPPMRPAGKSHKNGGATRLG